MTRVRWTSRAADDLARITERIQQDNSAAALGVARRIYRAIAELDQFPRRGRVGIAADTRELVFPPWPYVVVYEVGIDHVNILRIRHAAQNPN